MLEIDVIGRLVLRSNSDLYVAKKLHRHDIKSIEFDEVFTFTYADYTYETAKLTGEYVVVFAGGQTVQLDKVDDINFGDSMKHKK